MIRSTTRAIAVVAALGTTPALALAQTPDYPQMSQAEELRLAMSAGPLNISQHADVYVMGARGFEKALTGTNGWACLVTRTAANKTNLAPHCLNPQAVRSVLPAFMREAEMQVKGMDAETIDADIRRQFTSGTLTVPSGPAYAYMLSEGQRLGPNDSQYRPHFMMYVPYATNETIGGDPTQQQFGFVGPYQNHPLSTVVIVMTEFVSPNDVVLPRK